MLVCQIPRRPWMVAGCCWLGLVGLAEAGELPPAATYHAATADAQLYLELLVNQVDTGKIIAVEQRNGRLFLPAAQLQSVGVNLPSQAPVMLEIGQVAGLEAEYDHLNQRLLLSVPPHWLPSQRLGSSQVVDSKALTSFGALLNYDLYLNDSDDAGAYLAAWNELRVFDAWGTLSNTGQYRHGFGSRGTDRLGNGYLRYDTVWRFSDDAQMLTYEVGDVVSRALPWSSSVRLGGLQLSRDFGVRPDLITYPLPQFAGEAAVPSSVDLFVNGFKSSTDQVQPGPYTLTNIPFINGAGEAVVVTTDALGRQVSTTVPFYVASSLLQKGLADFSLATGSLRRDYAQRSFNYGSGVASGNLRYGVSEYFTVETHAEASSDLALGGVGGNVRLGQFGVLNSAVSHSRFEQQRGRQLSVGYQYNNQRYSLSYQRQERFDQYADLSVIDSPLMSLSKRSQQVTASLNFQQWGSLGAGYFDIVAADDSRTRLLNLTWSRSLWQGSSFYLSANRELDDRSWAMQAQVIIPFDLRGSLSMGVERNADGKRRERINVSSVVPTQGGLGYNLGYARGQGEDYRQADLTWRLQSVQLQAGVYGTAETETRWADASGSLVWMDRQVFAANRIDDAFVVVSTDGFAKVPVLYENQPVGETDRYGRLLVPWSSGYYSAKYEIDPLNLPANVRTAKTEQRLSVRRGSGYLLEFELSSLAAASIELVDEHNKVLPLGSQVTHQQSGAAAVVGWDGLVYLENLAPHNLLQVNLADGRSCQVQFAMPTSTDHVPMIGPLICR